jgi:menaquinone-dependent protoporphyrinogen IX oxidase
MTGSTATASIAVAVNSIYLGEKIGMKTMIVCASRYGSTMEVGRWIADRLPWTDTEVYRVDEAPDPGDRELVFLGGGVYNEQVDAAIVTYAQTHSTVLQEKSMVAFAVCLDTRGIYMKGRFYGGWLYLDSLLKVLDSGSLVHAGVLSGEINPKKLSDRDRDLLMHFYTKILKRDMDQVPFRTLMNKAEVWEFVEKTLARLKGRF